MANSEEKALSKLIIEKEGNVYVMEAGGGTPGDDTVGTRQIINDSVEMEDLNRNVKDKMVTDDDRVTQEQLDSFVV